MYALTAVTPICLHLTPFCLRMHTPESSSALIEANNVYDGLLVCLQIAAVHSGWQSLQAMLQINRFWGIIIYGWAPAASLAAAAVAAATAGGFWYLTHTKQKPGLLAAQLVMHLLVAACSMLAMLCWVYPSRIDSEVRMTGAQQRVAASTASCGSLTHC